MDIMIDIETLGIKPGSVITSIGAVAFNAQKGTVASSWGTTISIVDAVKTHGLSVDPETILWWLKQDKDAQNEMTKGKTLLRDALNGLRAFVEDISVMCGGGPRVWANSPNFDISLLEAAYTAIGDRDYPWAYRDIRDVRTLLNLAGVDLKASAFWGAGAVKHNASDDALAQARAVIEAYHRLGLRAA